MNSHVKNVVETGSAYLSTRTDRGSRIAGHVLHKAIEKEGGTVTGRVVVAILVILAVVGLAFVAYRLLVLDLVMSIVEQRS